MPVLLTYIYMLNEAISFKLAAMNSHLQLCTLNSETSSNFLKKLINTPSLQETDQVEYLIPESSSLSHQLQNSDPKFVDFLSYFLQINPRRRPTASEALEHEWLSISYN